MDITITFDCSFFGSAEGMDVAASGHAYAIKLKNRVALEYPDASVSVEFNDNTSGARSTYSVYNDGAVYGEDDEAEEAIQDHLHELTEEVFDNSDFWVCEPQD